MQSQNPDYEAISAYFGLQSTIVQKNAEIVDRDLVGQDFMLHIDKNTPPSFAPRMPPSADKREDATTARITVSPNLIGCYIGYQRGHNDFFGGSGKEEGDTDPYRGGYDICELKFNHCLKVGTSLVPDAPNSQEHWLVAYTQETREYVPIHVGKMFVSKITQKAVTDRTPATFLTIYIEVVKESGFKFSPRVHLDKGYWKAEVLWKANAQEKCTDEENFKVQPCGQDEYEKAKRLSAALLEHQMAQLKTPHFARW